MEDKNKNIEKGQEIEKSNKYGSHNTTVLIITLNISGLNTPIKDRDCQGGSKNKVQLTICFPQEIHFKHKNTYRLKESDNILILIKNRRSSYSNFRQNRPQTKESYQG